MDVDVVESLWKCHSVTQRQFLSLMLNIINQTTPGRHFVGSKTQINFIKLMKYVKGCSEHNKWRWVLLFVATFTLNIRCVHLLQHLQQHRSLVKCHYKSAKNFNLHVAFCNLSQKFNPKLSLRSGFHSSPSFSAFQKIPSVSEECLFQGPI